MKDFILSSGSPIGDVSGKRRGFQSARGFVLLKGEHVR